jgi:hypothetical protein
MNPATPVQPLRRTVRIPRLIASCGDKTPRGNAHCESGPFEFPQTGAVADFFRRLGDRGIPTLVKDTSAKASTAARTPGQAKALREGGYGGELMNVNLDLVSADGESSEDLVQGRKYPISTDQTVTISYTYFYPAKDRKAISEEREALREQAEREARNNQQPKSRCLPIAAGETNKQILDRFPLDASGFRSYLSMFDALAKLGCQVEIAKYVKGRPSATRSYVTDVVGTDAKRHTISVALAQPGNHDFIFTIRENPAEFASQASRSNIPIGTDGKLTVSKKQQNRFTVQVIERSTGRLVAGIPVTFVGKNGQTVSQNTNGDGETTFVSSLTEERDYRLSAEFREMEGWITIRAENRGDKAFTSMANRRIVRSSKDLYAGNNESELEFAKGLPIVPALLGSGDTKAVTSIPRIQQTQVTTVALSGAQSTGQYNVVSVPTNSSTLVGAAPGLLAIGGGDAAQAARQQRRLGIPNPLEFLGAIIGPLKSAIDSGVSNIKNALSSPNQIAIAATANLIGQAGGNLISDKGLGVISVGGGNLISDKGLGVISVGGGNLIGRVGGNLSSDKGIGVIAGDACGCTPVHGGRIISRDGAG